MLENQLPQLWAQYSQPIVMIAFWGLIGVGVLSPLLLAYTIYQRAKVGNYYHIKEALHSKRRQMKKETALYATISYVFYVLIVLVFVD